MSNPTNIPSDAPPSYETATKPNAPSEPTSSTLSPNTARNGIPPEYRRSMEDEGRPLPTGWIRQYDSEQHHHFYVDTNSEPPRSIWTHPYDDEQYLGSLSKEERTRIETLNKAPTEADISAMSSDEDDDATHAAPAGQPPSSTSASTSNPSPNNKPSLGRRMKDKLTNSTHEERVQARRHRALLEQQAYERHRQLRQAMAKAMDTGEPQYIGKDPKDGKDVYVEPPYGAGPGYSGVGGRANYNTGHGIGGPVFARGYGQGHEGHEYQGYNPYGPQGPYANPNARFLRPAAPYRRPYGGGYGGGMGLPIMGGLAGGMLLGGALGGGF